MTHIGFAMASLLNGLCQGIVVGAVVWLALKFVPRINPATRFAILGLALLAVAALSTKPFSSGTLVANTPVDAIGTSNTASTTFTPINGRLPALKNPTGAESNFEAGPESTFVQRSRSVAAAESTPPRAAASISLSPVKTAAEQPLLRIRSERVLIALAMIWAVLSLGMLARLAAGYRRLRQLKSRATPAPESLQIRQRALQAMNGISRRARLLVSSEIVAPISLGFLDAAVLIPEGFVDSLSDSEAEHILLHELAHLQRRDDWTNLAQKFIEAVVPIQPAIYWIASRMGLEREMACDDWVIAAVGTAKSYAASLTKVAELSQCAYEGLLAAGVSGNRSQLFKRVRRMLERGPSATPKLALGPLGVAGVLVVVAICVGARSPQMIAFAQDETAVSKYSPAPVSRESGPASTTLLTRTEKLTREAVLATSARIASFAQQAVSAPPAPAAPAAPTAPAASTAPTAPIAPTAPAAPITSSAPEAPASPAAPTAPQAPVSPSAPMSPVAPTAPTAPMAPLAPMAPVASQSGQTHMEMTERNGWNSMTVKVDGAIEFTDDDHDVKSLSPYGHFRLEEGTWLSGRAYDVKADAAGNLTKTYFVRGTAKPLDDDARAWLARLLPEIIRESGIDAGPRVARILRQGGPQAVMTEIGLIHSDGSKRIYLEQLFSQATLNPAQLKDAAGLIRGISSDGDKAHVLIAVDSHYLTSESRPQLFDAIGSINSDGDKRRVLSDVVQKDPKNMETLVGAAAVAKHISSDGDKAEVLIEIANSYRASDQLRATYFDAVDSISSDGDHARVLEKLLDTYHDDRATVARVFQSAQRIASDGDKAAVLTEAAVQYSDDPAMQKAFFDAANSISSDGDHQRVLVAVVHRQGISSATLAQIANSAQRISSDGDKARALIELSAANVEQVRDPFFAAVDSIHSDGDRSRVLIGVLDKPGTSSAMAIAAIHSATGMSSDGDKGRVLLEAAGRYSKDPAVNEALRKAVSSLSSDGEYRAVMSEIARRNGSS